MRYQLWRYENGRVMRPADVIEAADRRAAVAEARSRYGGDSGGASAIGVRCTFCEDRGGVGNARRWTDASAPAMAACPRCGNGPDNG